MILITCLILFIFSAIKLTRIFLEYKQGTDIYNNIGDEVLNEDPHTITIVGEDGNDRHDIQVDFSYDHDALKAINPDGVGYLYIPAVDIRLPIAHTNNNYYYLKHAFDKTQNSGGTPFIDYRIVDGLNASNVIIYGHNMSNGGMFHNLKKYSDVNFYNKNNNKSIYIYTEDIIKEYYIFAYYITPATSDTYTYNFSSTELLQEYAGKMKAKSAYETGVDVSNATQVLTLSTCVSSYNNDRIIVQAVLVGTASTSGNTDNSENVENN